METDILQLKAVNKITDRQTDTSMQQIKLNPTYKVVFSYKSLWFRNETKSA